MTEPTDADRRLAIEYLADHADDHDGPYGFEDVMAAYLAGTLAERERICRRIEMYAFKQLTRSAIGWLEMAAELQDASGEKWAKTAAKQFCQEHADELRWLIQTYADADAEKRLVELRERFWSLPQEQP